MKKLLIAILILSVFVGVFAMAPTVNAQFGGFSGGLAPLIQYFTGETADKVVATSALFVINQVLGFFMWLSSWLLFMAGTLFNYIIVVALNVGGRSDILRVVDFGWSLLRDIANILFIFIILYIGISTILNLRGGSDKKLLIKVVIFALLINFSLFFTKVIVDTSNIIAIGFYNAIIDEAELRQKAAGATQVSSFDAGLSDLFMDKLNLATIQRDETGELTRVTPNFQEESSLVYIMGTGLILTTTFVLLAGAFLFAIRTIVLIFLMILAPLAYVGHILPGMSKHAKEWWDKLLAQAYFAPLYMILIFVSIKGLDALVVGTELGYDGAITTISPGSAAVFFNFLLVIGMMIAALVISKKIGAAGADFSQKAAGWTSGKVTGFAGRQTFGRLGERIARSEDSRVGQTLKNLGASKSRVARGISTVGLGFADKTAETSFDVRGSQYIPGKAQKGGFKKDFEDKVKREADRAKGLGTDPEDKEKLDKLDNEIKRLKERVKEAKKSGDDTAIKQAQFELDTKEKEHFNLKNKRQIKRAEIRKKPTIASQAREKIAPKYFKAKPSRFGTESAKKIEDGLKTNWGGGLKDKLRKLAKDEFKDEFKDKEEKDEESGGSEEKKDENKTT